MLAGMDNGDRVPGAIGAGQAAGSDASIQAEFAASLSKFTGGIKDRPIIVYCHHAWCFLSYNVALRAVQAGYSNVFWMRAGIEGWKEAGYAIQAEGAASAPAQPQLSAADTKLVEDCRGKTQNLAPAAGIGACTTLLEPGKYPGVYRAAIQYYRGVLFAMTGQHGKADDDYTAALAGVTDAHGRAAIYTVRADSRIRAGREEEGEKDIASAISADPKLATAFSVKATLDERRKNYAGAVADAEEAIRLAPEEASYLNEGCWLRAAYTRRDLAQARKYCDKAIALEPSSYEARDTRGMLNLREKRYADAWDDYDRAYQMRKNAHYLFGRGIAAIRLGRQEAGSRDIGDAIRQDPKIAERYAEYGVTREFILP